MLCAAIAVASLPARPAAADAATAEALFREGKRLLDDGQLDAACARLAESHAQDPSSGTLLNLALCHERQDKLATAWGEYAAAGRLATTQGRAERAEVARKKAEELEPKLARIVIRATDPPAGLRIERGTDVLGPGAIGVAVPVDAGTYSITATAPGRQTWSSSLEVADGETKTVDVPALALDAGAGAPNHQPQGAEGVQPASDSAPASGGLNTSTIGWIVGGVGLASLGVGAAFGVSSLAAYRDAEDLCPTRRNCSGEAQSERDRAEGRAWVANVAIALGVVSVGVGTYLVLTSKPSSGATTIGVHPRPEGVEASFGRSF